MSTAADWKSKVTSAIMLIVLALVLYNVAKDPDRADPRWSAHAQVLVDKPCPASAKCDPSASSQPQADIATSP